MKAKKKSRHAAISARPKDVWNSVRKLEGHLRKADIQAEVFMESLQELRGVISFEVRREIVQKLCSSVNGDILHELFAHRQRMDEGALGTSVEYNAVLSGIFDCLETTLEISPFPEPRERLSIRKADAKAYSFEEYPEALDDETVDRIDVEVLRAGWKVKGKMVVKPTVCEVAGDEGKNGHRREAASVGAGGDSP